MTVHDASSASITNLDATPSSKAAAGAAGMARVGYITDYVTVPASAAATSVFRFVRVPSNTMVQALAFESEAQGAGKVQLGVYYPDDNRYLAPGNSGNNGLVVSASLFSGDIDCASAVTPSDKCLMSIDKKQMPLWQAAGLSSDPGGYLDICATVHTTDVTTGTGKMGVAARVVMP